MLLTISTTHRPATDLGYLLRKNPARPQSFELRFGKAHVFYPEATEERCTVALLMEIDPVGLVRNRRGPSGEGRTLEQYVNDRPYAASSFLSVTIADVFGSALSGTPSKDRPNLHEKAMPLVARLPVVPCRAGEELLRKLFEPLGYAVTVERHPLEERFPEWGESRYFRLEISAVLPLHQLLSHLYVLIPVLDNDKHYWVGDDEVEKLLRHGEGWLASHPEREAITRRYLRHRKSLVEDALAQLADESDPHPDETADAQSIEEAQLERTLSLNDQRLGSVLAALKASAAQSVLDLGCGEGKLVRLLLEERQFSRITAMDVSHHALEVASDRLRLDRMPATQRERVSLLHGSLMYRDERLKGHDAAAVVEVIEHLDSPRLAAFERVLFECARPRTVIVTTPNREYNVLWATLPAGEFRHRDHRFEWSRAEFTSWCDSIARRFGYSYRLLPIGPEDPAHGSPTQMAIFDSPREA